MSIRTSLLGASCVIVQPLLLNAISLPVTAYIISTLGPLEYGQWSVALTLTASFGVLTNLGLRSFFIRAVARRPDAAPQAFAEQLGLRMLLAIGSGSAALGVCHVLGYPWRVQQCASILVAGAVFTAAAGVVSDLLSATEKLPVLSTINLASGLALNVASVAAMWFHTGPLGLAAAYLLGPVITGVLSVIVVHRRLFPVRIVWSLRRYWALLKEAKVLGLQLFIMNFGVNAENLLVPKLVGISSHGFFVAGSLLSRRLEVVPDGLNTAFYPVMARSYHGNPREGARSVWRLMLIMLAACIPVAIGVFVLADPISRILFPHDFELCRTIMRITIWWVPLVGQAYAMGYALNAAGRERDEARLAIAGTIASLVISVVLILKFGLIGACIGLVAKGAIALLVRVKCLVDILRPEPALMPAEVVEQNA